MKSSIPIKRAPIVVFTQGWQRRVELPKNTSSENLIKVNTARKKFCNTPVIGFFCEDMFYCENHTQFLIDPQFVSASVTHEVHVCSRLNFSTNYCC